MLKPNAEPDRRVFDGINVLLLCFVAVCFFLPLMEVSCGPVKAAFSGMNLAFGTDPSISGPASPNVSREAQLRDQEEFLRKLRNEDIPRDLPASLILLAAAPGALLFLRAFSGNQAPVTQGSLAALPAILLAVFIAYSAAGFGIERELEEDARGSGEPTMVAAEKTTWFYLVFGASAMSLVLALARRHSPRVHWEGAAGQVTLSGSDNSSPIRGASPAERVSTQMDAKGPHHG